MFGLSTLGFVHTALSLIALATGLVVVVGLVAGRRLDGWIAVYFVTAVLTDATGFALPRDFDIVHWLGLAMAAALLAAILARYRVRHGGTLAADFRRCNRRQRPCPDVLHHRRGVPAHPGAEAARADTDRTAVRARAARGAGVVRHSGHRGGREMPGYFRPAPAGLGSSSLDNSPSNCSKSLASRKLR